MIVSNIVLNHQVKSCVKMFDCYINFTWTLRSNEFKWANVLVHIDIYLFTQYIEPKLVDLIYKIETKLKHALINIM